MMMTDDDVLLALYPSLSSSADNGSTTDIKMVIMWIVDGADCCLIGIVSGVTMNRNITQWANNNTTQYL